MIWYIQGPDYDPDRSWKLRMPSFT